MFVQQFQPLNDPQTLFPEILLFNIGFECEPRAADGGSAEVEGGE